MSGLTVSKLRGSGRPLDSGGFPVIARGPPAKRALFRAFRLLFASVDLGIRIFRPLLRVVGLSAASKA